MGLFEFLTSVSNLPFSIAGVFLIGLVLLETVGVLVAGAGPSHLLDALDGKNHHVDLGEFAAEALGYLHWGKVPMIVLLSSLAGLYSIGGFGVQSLAHWISGGLLPALVASIPAGMVAVFGTHFLARPLARLMPSDTGDAITRKDMLGMVGTVISGPVSEGLPGEARVRDFKGGLHVVRIEAAAGQRLAVGSEIVLTGSAGPFYVAASADPNLSSPILPAAVAGGAESKSAARTHQEH